MKIIIQFTDLVTKDGISMFEIVKISPVTEKLNALIKPK